jgi:uncharacterized membrane protein YfcA
VGATVQGSVGIGLGFVSVPLLVLINPEFVPGPLLLAALILTISIAARDRQAIEFAGIWWAVLGRVLGTSIGIMILGFIPADKLAILFGIMIILAVSISLVGFRLKINGRNLLATGTLSGLMGTTAAIGGVALALIYQDFEGPRLRGTLSGIFVLGTIISILGLSVIGKFGWHEVQMAAVLVPGVMAGFFISFYTARFLDKNMIRPIVLSIAALAGIVVILKGLV